MLPQFGECKHWPSITLTLDIAPTTTYVTLAPLTTYTQTINDKSTNHFFNGNISLHTHTTSSLPSTMKRTQTKLSTASKSSASKKQSILPVTQKVTTPALAKQTPMPSTTASIVPAATSEKRIVHSNIVVNCPSKSVFPSRIVCPNVNFNHHLKL